MTLHWWHHWFWITGQAPVVLMLLVALPALPRCLGDEGASRAGGSRRLLGFAGPGPGALPEPPGLPVTYLTTAALPLREPKAIGLAPPTHPVTRLLPSTIAATAAPLDVSSTSLSAEPASISPSPSAVVEILEEVEEAVKTRNGSQSVEAEEEGQEVIAELVTTPASSPGDVSPPTSFVVPLSNSSVAQQGDTSEEMINDEPAEQPATPSSTPAAGSGSPAGVETTSESPSSTSGVTPAATVRPSAEPPEVPVHPAVIINTTPVPVTTPNSSRTPTTATATPTSAAPTHSHHKAHVPEDRTAAVAPLGAVAPLRPHHPGLDAGSITGIVLGIVVFAGLVGTISFVLYRRRYLNKPQTLNDKCSNPDSSGYIDDSTLRENSEEMYSLDNDSFLNSLEAMTIQNYWTDSVKHTKL